MSSDIVARKNVDIAVVIVIVVNNSVVVGGTIVANHSVIVDGVRSRYGWKRWRWISIWNLTIQIQIIKQIIVPNNNTSKNEREREKKTKRKPIRHIPLLSWGTADRDIDKRLGYMVEHTINICSVVFDISFRASHNIVLECNDLTTLLHSKGRKRESSNYKIESEKK
jgi:hypothetical protein